jgi:molecular chaperone GrpE
MTEERPTGKEEELKAEKVDLQETTLAAHVQRELQECQEKYVRLLAESENARKRMQKEKQELTKYAVENVLVEFLHPLDSFSKALSIAESMSSEVRNWALGFEMILAQFKQVLTEHGIVEYDSYGKSFDPHLHEAVDIIESADHAPGTVIEECVRGYKMGERILRVARVKVTKIPEEKK